ncbi:MAG: diguanylate cyclase [Rubrivivax sp.]|nr:diguanylate cyclase [Rubrivivax sp.]MDP3613024.1 diguanylate cyclase [Rubrivivax sp.]
MNVKFKRLSSSLVTRLVLMSLVLLVLGTLVSYWQLTRFLRQDLTAMVAEQQATLADYVARDVDAGLALRLQFLQRTARDLSPGLLQRPADLQAWLARRHQLQPLFDLGLLVLDPAGRVITMDSPGPTLGAGSFAPEVAQLAQLAQRPPGDLQGWVGSPRRGLAGTQPMLPLVAPLRSADGALLGLLLGVEALTPKGFLSRVLEQRIAPGTDPADTGNAPAKTPGPGLLLVAPHEGLFVASTQPDRVMQPTPASGINLLHDRAMAGYRGSGTTVNARGVEEIAAIASVPLSGWFVVARMPTAQAFASVTRLQKFILQRRLPVVAVVVLLIAGVFAWLLRPLLRSAALAERMTRGEVPLAPLPVVRDDEVGHLTDAFNRLLAKLGEQQAELERLAHHDNLTGLPNRKLLIDRLQQALSRAQRQGSSAALLFMDLDGFKGLNDSLGHETGDAALRAIAQRLAVAVRQGDTVARLGGDEFVLLAPDLAGDTQAAVAALVQKCRDAVRQPLQLGGRLHTLGVSIGTAVSRGQHSPSELLEAADKAMYASKPTGREAQVSGAVLEAPDATQTA